jgi:Recombination, repair and ssDNA binding protein UvsY
MYIINNTLKGFLMSLIDEWIEESETDLYIDYNGNLGEQAASNHKNFTKWLSRLKKHSLDLRKQRIREDKLNSELWIYYTGKANPDVYKQKPMDNRFLKSEVKEAISIDQEMMKMRLETSILEEYVDTLDRILKAVKDRDWAIKAAIDWRKFESGL